MLAVVAHCYQQGILFEGGQEVLLTDSHWRMVVQYNLTRVEEDSRNLSIMLDQVKGYYNQFFQSLLRENMSQYTSVVDLEAAFRYEYAVLQQDVSEYTKQVADLSTLLARKRVKRGLIDAGGHLLKFLFGTLDGNDLEVIDEQINYLYDTTSNIAHNAEERTTIFNNMQEEISNHSRTINQMLSNLKQYHSVMHTNLMKLVTKEHQTQAQLRNLFQYQKLSATLADVKDTVGSAIRKITRLHQAVEDLAGGKVGSNLISPHDYLELLQSIEKVIPPPANLYLPVVLENIHQYYDIPTVTSYTTQDTLRVILQVPLKLDSNLFQAYDVIPYPVYDEKLGKWTEWDVEKQKLVISKDRQLYTIYKKGEFSRECHGKELVVCPVTNALMRSDYYPSCPVDLIMGKKSKSCNRKIVPDPVSPVLVKTESRWLFSASKEHKLTLNCYELNGAVNVTSKTIGGVGILNELDRCDVISDGFRLPARIHGSSNYQIKPTELLFPELSSIYTAEENGLLEEDWNVTSEVLQGLENELSLLGVKEYHLEGVFDRLRTKRAFKSQARVAAVAVGSIVSVLVGLILAWTCFRRWPVVIGWHQKRRLRHQGRRITRLAKLMEMLSSAGTNTSSDAETAGRPTSDVQTRPVAAERTAGQVDPPKFLTVRLDRE